MTVNKERVQLLVDALRSGEFPQGKGMLRTSDDTYCCIGVGCEVARRNGIGIEWERRQDFDISATLWSFDGYDTEFSATLMAWYGFTPARVDDGDPALAVVTDSYFDADTGAEHYITDVTMTSANDERSWTFPMIADAIEAKYLTGDGGEGVA